MLTRGFVRPVYMYMHPAIVEPRLALYTDSFNNLISPKCEVFRTHTVTTYPAPTSPGHQHWVSTSLGRHADAAAARILPVHDARGFLVGRIQAPPGPAQRPALPKPRRRCVRYTSLSRRFLRTAASDCSLAPDCHLDSAAVTLLFAPATRGRTFL